MKKNTRRAHEMKKDRKKSTHTKFYYQIDEKEKLFKKINND